jgi:predicted Rossmann fold flavoprotein
MPTYDVIIIGAGAAGLMCAIEAAKRQRQVLVLEHTKKAGKKILMSGGGRCNFTNYHIHPDHYLSHNPHFAKSALSRYTQWDFLALVEKHGIAYHEKTQGQLFCDHKSSAILNMLLSECQAAKVTLQLNTKTISIRQDTDHSFLINTTEHSYRAQSLVIATGGLSIPTLGASPFGYQIAQQFGLKVWPTRAGLVPLTLQPQDKVQLAPLAGIACKAWVTTGQQSFQEPILFTHRGLSGPAILQLSSYWSPGSDITINLIPDHELFEQLKRQQIQQPQRTLKDILSTYLANRLVSQRLDPVDATQPIATLSHQRLIAIVQQFQAWRIRPNGTEGYRTAEVTLGGVDCNAISSKTLQANKVAGLYFIGEVLDVSGWLGGYNFQWAWSSGWAAGQYV